MKISQYMKHHEHIIVYVPFVHGGAGQRWYISGRGLERGLEPTGPLQHSSVRSRSNAFLDCQLEAAKQIPTRTRRIEPRFCTAQALEKAQDFISHVVEMTLRMNWYGIPSIMFEAVCQHLPESSFVFFGTVDWGPEGRRVTSQADPYRHAAQLRTREATESGAGADLPKDEEGESFLDSQLEAAKHIPTITQHSRGKVVGSCECCRHRLANITTGLDGLGQSHAFALMYVRTKVKDNKRKYTRST